MAGTFSRLHMDSNGHGTHINVNAGVKIWHVLTPKPGKSFTKAFGCIDPFKDYDVELLNSEHWDIETVILQDGMRLYVIVFVIFPIILKVFIRIMRPNTLYFVFTPVPSICHGGYYYGSTVMSDTCFAIYHTFVQGYVLTNSDHESQGFDLLWHIVCYYHDQFSQIKGMLSSSFIVCSILAIHIVPLSAVPHLLNISTFEGIMDIIYLSCIIELANVVMKRSYSPSLLSWTECYRCITVRGKAHTLLAWLSQHYELYTPDSTILNTFDDIFSRLLDQQAAVLLVYRQANPPPDNPSDGTPHISVSALKTALVNCLTNNVIAHTAFMNVFDDAKKCLDGCRTFA